MMKPVRDWQEVASQVASCKNSGMRLSNFFPEKERVSTWCENGVFFEEHGCGTQFFVREQSGFSNVFFLSKSTDSLARDWHEFASVNDGGKWIVELIGPDALRQPLEEVFYSAAFSRLATLQRMARRTPALAPSPEAEVKLARSEDAVCICNLLHANFDAETEQLPSADEILRWIANGTLLVERGTDENDVLGFAIFDLYPAALHLRYWFVSPSERGKGVGGRLLRNVFWAGHETRRQYLWVKTDNENAIAMYRHYGFSFESMKDVVMGCCT